MSDASKYSVSLQTVAPRAIAAVRARVPIGGIPALFKQYLDQVYAARAAGLELDGQNIFGYRWVSGSADVVDAEFGVGVRAPFTSVGAVVYTHVPSGEVATTTHWGDYAKLRGANEAIVSWIRANGRKRAGVSWEVYGHWTGNPADQRTDVFYLLEPMA